MYSIGDYVKINYLDNVYGRVVGLPVRGYDPYQVMIDGMVYHLFIHEIK